MKTLSSNKKALHDYQLLEKFEAGIVLTGPEVKSVKAGQINLTGSYVSLDKANEAWLIGCHISPYKPAAQGERYKASQPRKLLLKKKEIISLQSKVKSSSGLTILPVSVYNKGSLVKIQIALAKGKKKADKREMIKKREVDREIRKRLKRTT